MFRPQQSLMFSKSKILLDFTDIDRVHTVPFKRQDTVLMAMGDRLGTKNSNTLAAGISNAAIDNPLRSPFPQFCGPRLGRGIVGTMIKFRTAALLATNIFQMGLN